MYLHRGQQPVMDLQRVQAVDLRGDQAMDVVHDGHLRGTFSGWRFGNIFVFQGKGAFRQVTRKYAYRHAFHPHAQLLRDGHRHYLQVDGMEEPVEVKRV